MASAWCVWLLFFLFSVRVPMEKFVKFLDKSFLFSILFSKWITKFVCASKGSALNSFKKHCIILTVFFSARRLQNETNRENVASFYSIFKQTCLLVPDNLEVSAFWICLCLNGFLPGNQHSQYQNHTKYFRFSTYDTEAFTKSWQSFC